MTDSILVTGGCGFIGSNFVRHWLDSVGTSVINLDLLTYAGNQQFLEDLKNDSRHYFIHGDIRDDTLVGKLLQQYHPRAVIHFAAESHVDRSILGADDFIQTNIVGTFKLLEATRYYWQALSVEGKEK